MHWGWILVAYMLGAAVGLIVGGSVVAYLAAKFVTRTFETLERMDATLWKAGKE